MSKFLHIKIPSNETQAYIQVYMCIYGVFCSPARNTRVYARACACVSRVSSCVETRPTQVESPRMEAKLIRRDAILVARRGDFRKKKEKHRALTLKLS